MNIELLNSSTDSRQDNSAQANGRYATGGRISKEMDSTITGQSYAATGGVRTMPGPDVISSGTVRLDRVLVFDTDLSGKKPIKWYCRQ